MFVFDLIYPSLFATLVSSTEGEGGRNRKIQHRAMPELSPADQHSTICEQ